MAPKAKGKGGLSRAGRPRTKAIAKGVNDKSHAKVVKSGARYKWFGKGGAKKDTTEAGTGKGPRFYPADDIPVARKSARTTHKPTKLKGSIKPGSVLILLAGRFRGKRVVFLKALASGTLLVTGPYAVNGVPLRRVNQSYVIATSTTVDISGVTLPAHLDDAYFARPKEAATEKKEDDTFLSTEKTTTTVSDERKADQKAVDDQLVKAIAKVDMLEGYLKAKFSLKKGQKPHELKF